MTPGVCKYIPINMDCCWEWSRLSCLAKRREEDRSFICQFSFFYALLKGYTPEGIYKHSICLIPQLLVGLLHRNLSFWCLQTSLWRGEILLSFRSYFMNDMISCMLLQFLLLQEFTNSQISLKICLHRTDSGLLPSAATRKEIISVSAAIEWGASLRSITGEDARQKNRISTFFPVVTRESGFGLGFFSSGFKSSWAIMDWFLECK